MQILVIGGTGLIGYHAVRELLRRNHHPAVLAQPPLPTPDLLPADVPVTLADFHLLSDNELHTLLTGQDAVVFAAGADDRVLPGAPARDFFHRENAAASVRLVRLARETGVARVVLISSYFTRFDRLWPDKRLTEHHPYIRSRKEQATLAIEAAGDEVAVMILQLPYVFGTVPGRPPLWKPLIRYLLSPFPLFFFAEGGTNMMAARHAGEAVAGAVERGHAGQHYLVGEENLTWTEWLDRLTSLTGKKKTIRRLPMPVVLCIMRALRFSHRIRGKESGLDPVRFMEIQTKEMFYDPTPSRKALAYGHGDLNTALAQTVQASLGKSGTGFQPVEHSRAD